MRRTSRPLATLILLVALAVTLVPARLALALDSVLYIDDSGQDRYMYNVAQIHSGLNDTHRVLEGGRYLLRGDVHLKSLSMQGSVQLILENGSSLTCGPIHVPQGKTLTIYAQSRDENTMGRITASAEGSDVSCAGIGGVGGAGVGTVVINGGKITATGNGYSAGIGGSMQTDGSSVTINGGIIEAHGGGLGPGIGWCYESSGTVTINGGDITATGGSSGAGIGGGFVSGEGTITITGGTVNATGGYGAAGIGSGVSCARVTVDISEGTIVARGCGASSGHTGSGAGIGGGTSGSATVRISGGSVRAYGSTDAYGFSSPGIGGGDSYSDHVNVEISGGSVYAEGGSGSASIGASKSPSSGCTVKLTGGIVSVNRIGANTSRTDSCEVILSWTHSSDEYDVTNWRGDVSIEDGRSFVYKNDLTPATLPLPYRRIIVPAQYTVTFDGAGASGDMPATMTNASLGLDLPACGFGAPTGKAFDCWLVEGTEYLPGEHLDVSGDVTVTARWRTYIPVTTVALSTTTAPADRKAGSRIYVTAEVLPAGADDAELTWSTSNDAVARVASVDATGQGCYVKLLSVGTVDINATTSGPTPVTGTSSVEVLPGLVTSVSVLLKHPVMVAGTTQQATAEIAPTDAADKSVLWESSDPTVATADPDTGLVTAVAAGTTKIRATALDASGEYGEAELEVITDESAAVPYLDANGVRQLCSAWTTPNGNETDLGTGWYVISEDISFDKRVYAAGDVHLILTDGACLDLGGGFGVPRRTSLHIYAQSTGESKGRMTATLKTKNAVIGSDNGGNDPLSNTRKGAGDIEICGGSITVTNSYNYDYSNYPGAAIGGGANGADACGVIISGGDICAANMGRGAAIGSGYWGNSCNVTIQGGNVQATADGEAAAIGGGLYAENVSVSIAGGTVRATATDERGVGIGITSSDNRDLQLAVTISGGNVTAQAPATGVGIGTRFNRYVSTTDINREGDVYITITGGNVSAIAGSDDAGNDGVGIGYRFNDGATFSLMDIALGWTDPVNDRISCSSYAGNVDLTSAWKYVSINKGVTVPIQNNETIVPNPKSYIYVWLDGDGSELERTSVIEGETKPTYSKPQAPTKASDDEFYYVFDAWDTGTTEGTTTTFRPTFTAHAKDKPTLTVSTGADARRGRDLTVSGSLKDATGIGIVGATVAVDFGGIAYQATTASGGRYELTVVPAQAGSIDVVATFAGDDTHKGATATKTVTVKDTVLTTITLDTVSPMGRSDTPRVTGTLTDEDGKPIAGATISALPEAVPMGGASYTIADATTASDGSFELTATVGDPGLLAVGEHVVRVIFAGDATYEQASEIAAFDVVAPPEIQTTTLADGKRGDAYDAQLEATGHTPITWSITAGSLPKGLTLSSDGAISGTPEEPGTFSITVRAENAGGTDTCDLTLEIAKRYFAVDVTTTGEGTVTPSPASAAEGDTVTLTVSPETGHALAEISCADAAGNKVTLRRSGDAWTLTMPDAVVNVQARFEKLHSVSVTVEGSGTASANPATGLTGTTVDLLATPGAGQHLAEWRIVSGAGTLHGDTLTIGDTDVEVCAVFEQDARGPYTVSFDVGGIGSAPAPVESGWGPGSVAPADQIGQALNAVPTNDDDRYAEEATGHGWYMDANRSIEATYSTEISGDVTLYYKWEGPAALIEAVDLDVSPVAGAPIPADPYGSWDPTTSLSSYFVATPALADYEVVYVFWYNPDGDATFVAGKDYAVRILLAPVASQIERYFKGHASAYASGSLDPSKAFALTINNTASQASIEDVGARMASVEHTVSVAQPQARVSVSCDPTIGGTVTGVGTYDVGETATLVATPSTGFDFAGWYEGDTLVSADETYTLTVTADVTLTARFSRVPTFGVSVSVTPAGAGDATGAGTYDRGDTARVSATARDGYRFLRWEEAGASVSTSATYAFEVTGDRTLVAVFEAGLAPTPATPHTVTLHAATGGTATGGGTYATGETCIASAHAHAGNTFLGWYEGDTRVSTDATYTFTVTADITLTARFGAIPTFDVTLGVEPAGAGDAIGAGTYDAQATATITATPAQGYTFLRWEEAGSVVSRDATFDLAVTGNRALVAVFEAAAPVTPVTHTVVVHADTGGTASGGGTFAVGDECSIEASPHQGFDFQGWYAGSRRVSTTASYTFTVTTDVTLTARFRAIPTHDVTLLVEPAGAGDATGAGTYLEGEVATCTATPATGYAFVGWSEGGRQVSGDSSYTITVTGDRTLTAHFEATTPIPQPTTHHSVTVHAGSGGTATGGGTYAAGETCTVEAHPYQGFRFVGWYQESTLVGTDVTHTLTVTGDVTLTAHFEALPTHEVTLISSPQGAGDVSGAGTFDEEATVTVTATPADGYTFHRWEEDGTSVSAEATYAFTVTESRTLTAVFEAITPTPVASRTVSVHAATGGTAAGGGSYAEGETCTVEATPHEGYAFDGWYMGDASVSTSASYAFTVTGDVRLEARFAPLPTHDVTLTVDPAGAGDAVGGGTYDEGSTATVVATPATGYRFWRWERDGASVSERDTYSFKVTSAVSLVAVFVKIEVPAAPHTVTVDAGEGGTASGGGTFAVGETCTLVAHPHRGYAFAGWYEAGALVADTETHHLVVTGDVTFEARFRELETHTYVWLDGDDTVLQTSSWLEGEPEPTCDEIPTKAADAWFTYEFSHWDAGTTEGSTTTWRPTFTATAIPPTPEAKTFDIEATVTPAGAGTITGVGTYDDGSTCTVTATPHAGWRLVRWSEDGETVSTEPSLSFEVEYGRSLVAEFEPVSVATHRIDVAVTPEGAATATGAGTYDEGSEATVVVTPHDGYDFDGWYAGDDLVSQESTHTFTVTRDIALTARLTRREGGDPVTTETHVVDVRAASVLGQVAGTVTGAGVYDENGQCIVTATPHAGYAFVCWLEDGVAVSTEPTYTFDVTRDVSLEAVFEAHPEDVYATHTVLVHATLGGTATGGGTFDTHDTCTVHAHPHEGHAFEGWYVGDERVSTDASYDFEVTEDVVLVARFVVEDITVHVWLDGSDNEIDRAVVRAGEEVPTCEKVPEGSESETHTRVFSHWDEGEADVDVIYHRPVFKEVAKLEVSVTCEPADGGTATGEGHYAAGAVARLDATPHDHYDFVGWFEDTELIGTAPTHEITVEDDVEITARFERRLLYTVVWLDGDGEALHTERRHEGEDEPTCDKVPTKASDDQYDYTFASWNEGTREGDVLIYSPIFTATRRPITYVVVSGGDATWVRDSGRDLTLTIKRPENDEETFERFVGVRLDGKDIPEESRAQKAGSLVLTLKASYLQGLAKGSHDLEVAFDDGKATTTLTVAEVSNNSDIPVMPEIDPSRRASSSTTPTTRANPTVPTGTYTDGLIRRTPIRSDGSTGSHSSGVSSTTDSSSSSSQTTQDTQRTEATAGESTTGTATGPASPSETTAGTSQPSPTTSYASTQNQNQRQTPVRSTLGGTTASDEEATTTRGQTPTTADTTPGTFSIAALATAAMAALAGACIVRRKDA